MMAPLRTTINSGDVILRGESLPTSLPVLYKYTEQSLSSDSSKSRLTDHRISSKPRIIVLPSFDLFTRTGSTP
ncbi:unnamed protein product [Pleuronectes platessa]|uniref:Uncharacterized protein n=1 Tax=Pleuronectes platessa TaxID=8262 RepID=A0A9N7ZCR6_PLEPL|nr:unnamed protein product [Pleuronectes platessa]